MSVDDVGTVRTAVISVAPWKSYADVLQPKFNLSIDEALKKSIATTRRSSLQQLNKTNVSLGVGLDKTAKSSIIKTTVDEEGKVCWGQKVGRDPGNVEKEDTGEYVSGAFLLAGSEMLKLVAATISRYAFRGRRF